MYIQNRNSAERVGNKSQFELYWKSHPHLVNIYCHRLSNKQIQSHYQTVADDQLELEISFLEGRINNKHPSICCIYHYEVEESPNKKTSTNHHFRLKTFTDRIIPFGSKDWNQTNILNALIGLKRLIMIYGSVKMTQKLFGKNEIGEVKMWISQKPYKNKPDLPILNEHQTVSTLREVLSIKNPLFSSLFLSCKSIRQCIQILQKLSKPPNKHRHSPSIGLFLPDKHFQPVSGHFSEQHGQVKAKPLISDKEEQRNKCNSQHHLFTPLWNSNENWFKTTNKMKVVGGTKVPNRSTSFFSNPGKGFNHFNQKKPIRLSGNYHQHNDSFKFFPTTPPSRFGTHQFKNYQNPSAFSHRAGQQTWRDPILNKGYDITIINNNVSNYISHFPKNHFPEAEFSDRDNLREAKTPEFTWTGKHNSQSPSSKQPTKRKGVPSFIKCKGFHSQQPSYPNSNQGTRVVINHQQTDNKQNLEETDEKKSCKRKEVKIFTFFKKERDSQGESQQNFYTPKMQGMRKDKEEKEKTSIKARSQSHFFQAARKGFQLKKEKSLSPPKKEVLEGEPPLSSDKNLKISEGEGDRQTTSSLELKRMLRKEYEGLLGFPMDAIDEQTPVMLKPESNRHSEDKKGALAKESELKDKIKQKQEAFAELKKEALKVLTDF